LKDKIEKIILDKGLTPSIFADTLGVPRSSISHLISGRNKPSLDMVQKIIQAFPDTDRDWLIFDAPLKETTLSSNVIDNKVEISEKLISNSQKKTPEIQGQLFEFEDIKTEYVPKPKPRESNREKNEQFAQEKRNYIEQDIVVEKEKEVVVIEKRKKIESIMIFYNDGTFSERRPE
ncbi:MAG: helix-turn-helix transcriptional regulator, partial [Pseudarcicella sp.]|nr:helix-turn-helix transcriptional regulator [Pseudarcicella sp.]